MQSRKWQKATTFYKTHKNSKSFDQNVVCAYQCWFINFSILIFLFFEQKYQVTYELEFFQKTLTKYLINKEEVNEKNLVSLQYFFYFKSFQAVYELIIIICYLERESMMSNSKVKVEELSQHELEELVSTNQRQFELNGVKVNYENNYMVSELDQNLAEKFIVTNYLCFQEDNKIKKYIEVVYENKKIRIRDQFQFEDIKKQKVEPSQTPKKEKKVQIVKRPLYVPTQKSHQKRDTKNIVKNIVKLFINWLSLQNIEILHIEVKKKVLNIIHKMNFNNSMIQAFADDSLVNPVFANFIQTDAEKFIEASKIRDKEAHITIIQYYLNILKSKHQLSTNKTNDKVSSQP